MKTSFLFAASLLLYASGFSQNVGIGTTTPQTKLHILSASDEALRLDADKPYLSLYSAGVYKGYFWKGPNSIELGSATGSNLPITFAPDGVPQMFVGVNGNVGIGTNVPLATLHIAQGSSGSTAPSSPLVVESNGNTFINLLSPNANETGVLFGKTADAVSGGIVYNQLTNPNGFQFRTNGNTTRMVLDQNGNLGIGTTDPAFRVDISGRMRIRTGADGEAGIFLNNAANNSLQGFIGLENDNYIGFYGGAGAGWALGMNTNNGYVKIMSRLGIGLNNPGFPLSFPNTTGDKISLWSDGSSTHYGFGIQGGLFQVFTPANNAHIAFGYGSSGAFTETMRIQGNGNVGIGVNDPGVKLDINGRMKIRTGTDGEAGIWLNNSANTGIAAFLGLQNDNYVGFYGGAAGWKFAMNTQTGALKINGTEGLAGQVITSNGAAASSWMSSTNTLFQNTTMKIVTTSINPGGTPTLIPGLSHTVNVSGNAKILVQFSVHINALFCDFCNISSAYIDINLNGVSGNRFLKQIGNTIDDTFSGSWMFSVSAGSYIIELMGHRNGPSVTFGCAPSCTLGSSMIVQLIPE